MTMENTVNHLDEISELRVSALALMAILSEKPMTGYEIKKLVDSRELVFWRDSFGSIYPNLQQLTRLGLTEKTMCEETGRRRTSYALTDKGREIVEQWLKLPAEQRPAKIELLLKLRFGYPMGAEALKDLLKANLYHQKETVPELYESLQYIDGLDRSLQLETARMTMDFWYRYTRMMIEWSSYCLERLEQFETETGKPLDRS